jgi:hypothetical protein
MCRTLPNQVADHAVISIAYPRIRCRYGGADSANKFVRIGLGKRLPILLPVEAIEFYTRQFKFGSDARGHRCLASTRSRLPRLACALSRLRANENIQVGAEDSTCTILKQDGFDVSIVQNPTLDLAGDVAATRQIISRAIGPVVLAAHSYGGGRHHRIRKRPEGVEARLHHRLCAGQRRVRRSGPAPYGA